MIHFEKNIYKKIFIWLKKYAFTTIWWRNSGIILLQYPFYSHHNLLSTESSFMNDGYSGWNKIQNIDNLRGYRDNILSYYLCTAPMIYYKNIGLWSVWWESDYGPEDIGAKIGSKPHTPKRIYRCCITKRNTYSL